MAPFAVITGEGLRQAALAGLGIVMLPTFIIGEDLRSGRLQQVLLDYHPPKIGTLCPVSGKSGTCRPR